MFIILFILAIIPAKIAANKGRKFWLWYLYGCCLLLPALIHATLFLKPTEEAAQKTLLESGYTTCPFCKEPVKIGATVCPHCQKIINQNAQ